MNPFDFSYVFFIIQNVSDQDACYYVIFYEHTFVCLKGEEEQEAKRDEIYYALHQIMMYEDDREVPRMAKKKV